MKGIVISEKDDKDISKLGYWPIQENLEYGIEFAHPNDLIEFRNTINNRVNIIQKHSKDLVYYQKNYKHILCFEKENTIKYIKEYFPKFEIQEIEKEFN